MEFCDGKDQSSERHWSCGDTEAYVMVVHNHAEFSTVDLSEWVAGGSASVFAATLNTADETLDDAPTKRVFIGR